MMMFGLITRKKLEKINKNIIEKVDLNKNNIDSNSKDIMELRLQVSELKGMLQVQRVREQTLQSSQTSEANTIYHKKAKKFADKVLLVNEIKELISRDLTTGEMYDIIVMEKSICRKSCFFKYLKIVRKQLEKTVQTEETN